MDKNRVYRLGLYEKSMPNTLTWVEKLNVAKEAGFDYVEMSVDESDAKLRRLYEDPKEIIEAIKETGVPISSICLSGHRKYPLGSSDPLVQKKSLEIMQLAVDLAAAVGARIIQLAGYDVYYEEGNLQTRADFEKNLKECALMAAKKGIVLGFETMETPFMDTVEKAMHYVNIVNSPYLGVYPDIGNLKNASLLYGVPVCEDLMTGRGHIFATHLKETVPGKYREIPFGTGHSEYIANLETLKHLGVRMFVGEFWYVNNEDWLDVVKAANVFLRDKLDKVF